MSKDSVAKASEHESEVSNAVDALYKKWEPRAEYLKVVVQMLIGACIVVLVAIKVCADLYELWHKREDFLFRIAPLEIVGYALAVSACVELAYMLFTDGPDEAVDPLILGLSATALIEVSRNPAENLLSSVVIAVCIAGIAALFWIRERHFKDDKSKRTRAKP